MKLTRYNFVEQCPKITKHKEFAFGHLQIPKRRALYFHLLLGNSQQNCSSPKLKCDPTGRNADLKINPFERIQTFLNSSNLIGQLHTRRNCVY